MPSVSGDRPWSRRQILAALGSGALAGCAGDDEGPQTTIAGMSTDTTSSTPTDTKTPTETEEPTETAEEWDIDPLVHDKLVGAHYYVWYNSDPGWENWLERVPGTPLLGEYSSSDQEVANQHVKWALEHGINWFNISWWGPESDENRILKEKFLTADLAEQIQFSILYESAGRFRSSREDMNFFEFSGGDNDNQLVADFEYLENTYFSKENYLKIDDRPVVFIYLASSMGGRVKEAFSEAKERLDSNPYLIGDVLSAGPAVLQREYMDLFDAVSIYNLYNPKVVSDRDFSEFVDHIDKTSLDWKLAAEHADFDYIPNVIPGYNDSIYRDNPVLKRSKQGFKELLNLALQRRSSSRDAILITSFNEWPEYTAIEPGNSFGESYLNIVQDSVTNPSDEGIDVSKFDVLTIDFNKTVKPSSVNPESSDDRKLALMVGDLRLRGDDGGTVASYDIGVPESEPHFVEGAHAPGENPNSILQTWRWFGGETGKTVIYFEPMESEPVEAEIRGSPMVDNEIEGTVNFNGKQTDSKRFGERGPPKWYTFSLEST